MRHTILAATVVGLMAVSAEKFNATADAPPVWAYRTGAVPTVRACDTCHLANGFGRPDSASLAGLPAPYIVQQFADYRRGVRKSVEPAMGSAEAMIAVAASTSDANIEKSSQHFAAIAYRSWIQIVEADDVPKTKIAAGLLIPLLHAGVEPIGSRIVEVAATSARNGLNDGGPGFVAYVPPGSVSRGETLVTTGGGGRTVRCGLCHGDDLKGLGPVPGLAGRSPSYTVRQLYDMQRGARHGLGSDLMRATVARLATSDMIAIAAYTASRQP